MSESADSERHGVAHSQLEYGRTEWQSVGPIGLDALARLVHLREEHFLGRPVPVQPVGRAALEGAQRPAVELAGVRRQQVLEERLGFHLRAVVEPALGLGPDRRQRIFAGTPRVWLAQLGGAQARAQVAPRRFAVHARFHRRVVSHAARLIFIH